MNVDPLAQLAVPSDPPCDPVSGLAAVDALAAVMQVVHDVADLAIDARSGDVNSRSRADGNAWEYALSDFLSAIADGIQVLEGT